MKRWKSGYWWNWYNDLVLMADDDHVDGPIPENEVIPKSEFVNYDLGDYQRSLEVALHPLMRQARRNSRVGSRTSRLGPFRRRPVWT